MASWFIFILLVGGVCVFFFDYLFRKNEEISTSCTVPAGCALTSLTLLLFVVVVEIINLRGQNFRLKVQNNH